MASYQKPKKLNSFHRAKGQAKPGLRLQRRDIQIIKAVYDHRFLDSVQINHLIEGSDQVILRRLQKLYHHGFLDRPPRQLYWLPEGSQHIVYALADKGADLLSEEFGIERGKIEWRKKNSKVKYRHIKHTLQISEFKCCLHLALKQRQNTDIIFWEQNSQNLKDHAIVDGEPIPVEPDAFFVLKDNDDEMYFFLEADQSSMTNSRFLNKLVGYWGWYRQGGYQKKFSIPNDSNLGFRVLTITKSPDRKENLRTISKMADTDQTGLRMFYFTCEKNYSLNKPGAILKPIWQTPRDETYHHLLE